MSQPDNDGYYRNNTVDLNTSEVKVTPREEGDQSRDEGPNYRNVSPINNQKQKRTHISPTEPKIDEKDGLYETDLYDDLVVPSTRKEYGQHVFTEQGQGQGHALSNVEEGDDFVKRGRLSSPPLSPHQRDLVYQSSKNRESQRPDTHSKSTNEESAGSQRVVYLMRSPRKSIKSADSNDTVGNSKRSTVEEELKSLSTTPRFSHEDLGNSFSLHNLTNLLLKYIG